MKLPTEIKKVKPEDFQFAVHPTNEDFGILPPTKADVGVVMGSDSDWKYMSPVCDVLEFFGICHEDIVLSAHRTEERMRSYAEHAHRREIKIVIAMAGGSAHLPGMLASMMPLVPVLGVAPLKRDPEAVGSMIAMPAGKPLAYMGGGSEPGRNAGATNAGIMAATILAMTNMSLMAKIKAYHVSLAALVPLQPYRVDWRV